MPEIDQRSARLLFDAGLSVMAGATIDGSLVYERPAFVAEPARLKDCSLGAFTLINSRGTTSLYRCRVGRYGQIGEHAVVGPPEHPQDWFSNHPFAFTRPGLMPRMYGHPEFARLAPDELATGTAYHEQTPSDTHIGHEVYVGAGSFVRRGVKVGHGAVIAAHSVVLEDVPPYAIVAGVPARIIRLRFAEPVVDRMLALAWWRYDLAPYKHAVDYAQVEQTLEFFEARLAEGTLKPLIAETYRLNAGVDGFEIMPETEPLPEPQMCRLSAGGAPASRAGAS